MSLYQKLKEYGESDYYGFHMPGHKRNRELMQNTLPYELDITEIEGFDDLHHAEGILRQAQEAAARLYHAEETHFLVNGSTVGLLSAVMGSVPRGGRILVARNCHRCVYHALELQGLEPLFVLPRPCGEGEIAGEVCAEEIRDILEAEAGIQAVVIVSPTYDGVVSDVKGIADVAHSHGIPLIVDEAHGAHFGFHPLFSENANQLGADLVIHSLHKTMPALTQTALLHINGPLAKRESVRRYLDMLQSSSPSYILMAGIDECIRLMEEKKEKLFRDYTDCLLDTREELKKMQYLRIFETEHYDKSKILIQTNTCNKSAKEVYKILLDQYHLQMEMVSKDYFLAMTSVGDSREGLKRLEKALVEIDQALKPGTKAAEKVFWFAPQESFLTCAQMRDLLQKSEGTEADRRVSLPWEECRGKICTEYVYLYPPGIPLLIPGERVSETTIEALVSCRADGSKIRGIRRQGYLEVWKDA